MEKAENVVILEVESVEGKTGQQHAFIILNKYKNNFCILFPATTPFLLSRKTCIFFFFFSRHDMSSFKVFFLLQLHTIQLKQTMEKDCPSPYFTSYPLSHGHKMTYSNRTYSTVCTYTDLVSILWCIYFLGKSLHILSDPDTNSCPWRSKVYCTSH